MAATQLPTPEDGALTRDPILLNKGDNLLSPEFQQAYARGHGSEEVPAAWWNPDIASFFPGAAKRIVGGSGSSSP